MDNEKQLKKRAKLWGGVAIVLIIIVLGIVGAVDNSYKSNTAIDAVDLAVSENDWVRGDINSEVVVVEYADFQCPACASYHSVVKSLEEKYGDNVAFIFRHFPLSQIHKNAFLAAQASEAAGAQGMFWEMHDMLFENQDFWSENNNAEEIFVGYAKELGLDESKFISDLDSKIIKDKVSESYSMGVKFGVNSTPSFFINGKKIANPRSFPEFESLIGSELSL